jgi:2-methylcitrate dehydratase PrpD
MAKEKSYFRELAEYFHAYSFSDIDDATLHQVKRALVNYLGGSIYTASHQSCRELLALIREMDPGNGEAFVWADPQPVTPMIAAFSNAARLSSIELNDGTKASAHPGIYVWSSVLATYQCYPAAISDVIRAVVFGYDVCTRMALLSIDRIRELGLHNPGFVGGLGAVSAAGLLRGLDVDQLCNAFGMTAALLPLCPFVSFVEGADTKDLYGGWGAYLAMFALEAAQRGLTGPETIIHGVKSLDSIFQGDEGKDVAPGASYFINYLSIKEFPACFAVNPAIKAALTIRRNNVIDVDNIASVLVDSYPYSYDLNLGVGENINKTSSRLSLTHSVAAALINGTVGPDSYGPEGLSDPKFIGLRHKIQTARHNEYGVGNAGRRACIIEITMDDGRILKEEFDATSSKKETTDPMLREKFNDLTAGALTANQQSELYDYAMNLEEQTTLEPMLQLLKELPVIH